MLFSESGSNEDKFSEYIEKYLGAHIETNGDYTNFDRYKNPYGCDSVFNWYNLSAIDSYESKHINPAIYITNHDHAKYEEFILPEDKEEYFIGTIIVYMNNINENVEIYYVNKSLEKSEKVYKFRLK